MTAHDDETKARIAEIEARAWAIRGDVCADHEWAVYPDPGERCCDDATTYPAMIGNRDRVGVALVLDDDREKEIAAFIAHARQDIPWLLSHLAAETKRADEAERERDEAISGREKRTAAELSRAGGEWLGAARSWLQRRTRNGDHVTWGSDDVIEHQFTVSQIEELAAEVASAAMAPQPIEARVGTCLRARWTAEAVRDALAKELDYMRRMADAYKATAEDRAARLAAYAKVVEAARSWRESVAVSTTDAEDDIFEAIAELPADEGGG